MHVPICCEEHLQNLSDEKKESPTDFRFMVCRFHAAHHSTGL